MEGKQISPIDVLKLYIECFDAANEAQSNIDLLLDAALSSSEVDSWTASQRTDMIFFCRQTQMLLASIFIIGAPLLELYCICKKLPNEKV